MYVSYVELIGLFNCCSITEAAGLRLVPIAVHCYSNFPRVALSSKGINCCGMGFQKIMATEVGWIAWVFIAGRHKVLGIPFHAHVIRFVDSCPPLLNK